MAQWLQGRPEKFTGMVGVMLAAAVSLGVSGDAASGPAGPGPRWMGLAFGTPVVTYRQQLGDPLLVTLGASVPERKARFWLAAAPSAILLVTERHGAVVGIEVSASAPLTGPLAGIEADPSGVRIGSTLDEVAAKHPAATHTAERDGTVRFADTAEAGRMNVSYEFRGGRLVADRWLTAPSVEVPQLPGAISYAEPAGDSEHSAILDAQSNERDGIAWEYIYLAVHRCGGAAEWRKTSQSTRRIGDRVFDVVSVSCPSSGATRDFYFDVTPFSGKM
jgi:hypothetical protein